MKDVPTLMAKGIIQAAVLPRASYKDLLVPKSSKTFSDDTATHRVIATSSIRRKAQWLNRYPEDKLENLRGNVNTRLRKVEESEWQGAIFAAAGLERIGLRPQNAVELDWMLPAPAQGAIIVVCREEDKHAINACASFHDAGTALCTKIERDFLRALLGGCATPISALAEIEGEQLIFRGNILTTDGKDKSEVTMVVPVGDTGDLGVVAARELLNNGGQAILNSIRNGS